MWAWQKGCNQPELVGVIINMVEKSQIIEDKRKIQEDPRRSARSIRRSEMSNEDKKKCDIDTENIRAKETVLLEGIENY